MRERDRCRSADGIALKLSVLVCSKICCTLSQTWSAIRILMFLNFSVVALFVCNRGFYFSKKLRRETK